MADAPPIKRHKGKLVLLAIAAALAGYVIIAKLGIAWFDATREEPGAEQAIKDAERASVQWLTYLSRSGRPDTEDGKRAAAELAKAAEAREAGKKEDAQRANLAAWQGYVSAFQQEAEEARKLWHTHMDGPWREKLAGAFPFDANADKDAPAETLAQMIHPARGALWAHRKQFEAMAGVEMPGVRFVAPGELATFLKAAEGLRDALYTDIEDGQSLMFQVSALGVPPGQSLVLTVGSQAAHLVDGEMATQLWAQGYGGCSLGLEAGSGAGKPMLEFKDTEWGLLRVLWKLDARGAGSWAIKEPAGPGSGEILLTIHHDRKTSAFNRATYESFAAPRVD